MMQSGLLGTVTHFLREGDDDLTSLLETHDPSTVCLEDIFLPFQLSLPFQQMWDSPQIEGLTPVSLPKSHHLA